LGSTRSWLTGRRLGVIVQSVDGKIIGDIEKGVFTKRVDGRVHMLRQPPAWAIDVRAFVKDVRPNCHTIVVEDTHAQLTYSVSVQLFSDKKGALDRRYGAQYYLPLKYWTVRSSSQKELL
jgi:hypothetical protein